MSRHALVAQAILLIALGAACAHALSNCVNELEIPGHCPPDTTQHGSFTAETDSLAPPDSVVGYVVNQLMQSPIQSARITIVSDTVHTLFTDSTGRFAAPQPRSPSWTIRTQMIGYRARLDTVRTPSASLTSALLHLRIGLEVQATDGPCSGYAMVCRRSP